MNTTALRHADPANLSPEQFETYLQSMDPIARRELLDQMSFDRDPDTALNNSVDRLFQTAEHQIGGDEERLSEEDDELQGRYADSAYDVVDVTAHFGGESSTATVKRLQDNIDEPELMKPRTIITLPKKSGQHYGVDFAEATVITQRADGKWQKHVLIELGDGAEDIFGATSIDETVELTPQDLREVYGMMTHPTKIRKHQRTAYRSSGGPSLGTPGAES